MRTIQGVTMLSENNKKFQSPKGDTTFTIAHGTLRLVVDVLGNVISPANTPLQYSHEDFMKGNQSGIIAKVKDFLTVTPDLDEINSNPRSIVR